ncbi:MAG: response regulator [Candidatus Acidiferrales bacterium]|jgi:CheY-like chemotaxis protein
MSDEFDVSAHGESQGEDITGDLLAASKSSKKSRRVAVGAEIPVQATPETSAADTSTRAERRRRRRALISASVRVRRINTTDGGADEISTTLDVSRSGILFVSQQDSFAVGMEVAVTFPYSKSPVAIQAEQRGHVARISESADGNRAVAIALDTSVRSGMVDSSGGALTEKSGWTSYASTPDPNKPLVLAVDADGAVRESLKTYLRNEGYEVIAVSSAREAHEVLDARTPALVIAEIEGDDLPGYDLCAHIKAMPRLQAVPVMLMTRSAYPSDYANAHSLGAIVCMAKPYRQERLGHVVRLLAPPAQANDHAAPPRAADPSRRAGCGPAKKPAKIVRRNPFRLSR